MESRAKLLGHPIHQMLIVFPLGLLGASVAFDAIYCATANSHWADISYYLIAGGILTGLLAGVFGLIDWLAIPSNTRAKRIGLWHGAGNVLVLILFAASWFLRRDNPGYPSIISMVISSAGLALALVTAWLGGELVDRLGVGVSPGAHVNSPNSLSGRPATEQATPGSPGVPVTG